MYTYAGLVELAKKCGSAARPLGPSFRGSPPPPPPRTARTPTRWAWLHRENHSTGRNARMRLADERPGDDQHSAATKRSSYHDTLSDCVGPCCPPQLLCVPQALHTPAPCWTRQHCLRTTLHLWPRL